MLSQSFLRKKSKILCFHDILQEKNADIKKKNYCEILPEPLEVNGYEIVRTLFLQHKKTVRAKTPWKHKPYKWENHIAGEFHHKAQKCALEAFDKLKLWLEDPPESFRKLVEEGKATNKVTIWVNEIRHSFSTVKRYRSRKAYFWHWDEEGFPYPLLNDFKKGTWIWESTLWKRGCEHPDLEEVKMYLDYLTRRNKGRA